MWPSWANVIAFKLSFLSWTLVSPKACFICIVMAPGIMSWAYSDGTYLLPYGLQVFVCLALSSSTVQALVIWIQSVEYIKLSVLSLWVALHLHSFRLLTCQCSALLCCQASSPSFFFFFASHHSHTHTYNTSNHTHYAIDIHTHIYLW